MPIAVTVDPAENLFTFRYEGEVTAEDWGSSLAVVAGHPACRPAPRLLVDRREAESVTSKDYLLSVRRHILTHLPLFTDGRCAVVVARPVDYGMVRMAQALLDDLPFSLGVFYDWDEAVAWLAGPATPIRD